MEKTRGLDIGAHHFKSQEEAKKFGWKMLEGYRDGEFVENDSEDFRFLKALVPRHPDAAEKIGPGVKRFYRDKAPKPNYGKSCFWIERIDGTKMDFAIATCVTGRHK